MEKKRLDKRGMLLAEETLKILVALISITFLIYFLYSLYANNQDSKKLELATSSLNHLLAEINSQTSEVEIYNPPGWYILSWPHQTSYREWEFPRYKTVSREGNPNSCDNLGWKTCLCICPYDRQDKCDEDGICFESDYGVVGKKIRIENVPLNLKIDYVNKKITK